MINRIGNWYEIELYGRKFNVLIQKDTRKVTCDPSTSIVFDENFRMVSEEYICEKIDIIMESMDWKTDTLND